MSSIKILVDSLADEGLTNAQMINAQEIVSRLNSDLFSVTMFTHGPPAQKIKARPNTRLVQLPDRRQTILILKRFLFGSQEILFYLKASPASQWYLRLKSMLPGRCVIASTIESQTDWQDETITPRTKRLVEQTVLRSDFLFSNSEFVKRSLEANYGLASEVVPTGVDIDFFAPHGNRPPNLRPRVLFVGALRVFKGPQTVLDAARRYPQADFVIVGDGVMAHDLRDKVRSLANVMMPGSLGRTAVREEYRAADIFLFPSRWEGSPRVLLEAAACGLPVIARKDYEPESVIDGTTGFLANTEDEMMVRLGQLIANPDLCHAMGQAGRSHAASFSWDVITLQWETIFTRLAGLRRKELQS